MGSTRGLLKTKLNYALGTSETNLFTQDKRNDAINKAVEHVVQIYPLPQYTVDTTLAFVNGVATLPSDFTRCWKLWNSAQQLEYVLVQPNDFDGNRSYTCTIKYDTTSTLPGEKMYIYPASSYIDQSADTGGAYANTYTLPAILSEAALDRLTFTPTQTSVAQVGLWIVSKGTGQWTVTLHDASNNLLASQVVENANLTNGQFNFFYLPYTWTAGVFHIHAVSTVADGTIKTNVATDMETASYEELYSTSLNLRYGQMPVDMTSDLDTIRLPERWDDGIADMAAWFLFIDSRNYDSAAMKEKLYKEHIAHAWSIENQRYQDPRFQRVESKFESMGILNPSNIDNWHTN
jgi:hypothetical protein